MSQPTPGQHGFESAGCGENQVNRFTTEAEIWHVHVAGQVIRTTEEHPFWVVDKGWVPTVKLLPGDILLGRDGKQVPVEEVLATGVLETVHNFRVAEYHTYFVGGGEWQFDV